MTNPSEAAQPIELPVLRPKLSDVNAALLEITDLLTADDRRLRIGDAELEARDPDLVRLTNVQHDLRLAAQALIHLIEVLKKHKTVSQPFMDASASDTARLSAFAQAQGLALDLELHIRSIYELLYAIRIMASGFSDPDLQLSPSEQDELNRLCLFRGSLLAHKDKLARLTRGSLLTTLDGSDVRFGIALQPLGERDGRELQGVFRRNLSALTKNQRGEENRNEQLQALYDHWSGIFYADRPIVSGLIARNGVKSDSPATLAEMVRVLVGRFFPRQGEIIA